MDHAMVFSTGYQANLGIISTIAGKGDYVVIDIDSHAINLRWLRDGQGGDHRRSSTMMLTAMEKRLKPHS